MSTFPSLVEEITESLPSFPAPPPPPRPPTTRAGDVDVEKLGPVAEEIPITEGSAFEPDILGDTIVAEDED